MKSVKKQIFDKVWVYVHKHIQYQVESQIWNQVRYQVWVQDVARNANQTKIQTEKQV